MLIFWTKFAQKRYFQSKTEKVNIAIELFKLKLVLVPNFRKKKKIEKLISVPPRLLSTEEYFQSKTEKSEHRH